MVRGGTFINKYKLLSISLWLGLPWTKEAYLRQLRAWVCLEDPDGLLRLMVRSGVGFGAERDLELRSTINKV